MTSSQAFDPAEFKRNIRTEWRSAAAGWRKWLQVVEAEEGGQRHSAKLVELAELQVGASVLDVGGGYGEPSLTAARVVGPQGRVVCTDISPEMLAVARERAADAGLANVEFVARDAEELEFDEESFDAVLSRATLMFLPDVAGTLKRTPRLPQVRRSARGIGVGAAAGRGVLGRLPRQSPRSSRCPSQHRRDGRERSRSAIPAGSPNSWRRPGSGASRLARCRSSSRPTRPSSTRSSSVTSRPS